MIIVISIVVFILVVISFYLLGIVSEHNKEIDEFHTDFEQMRRIYATHALAAAKQRELIDMATENHNDIEEIKKRLPKKKTRSKKK
jgi:Tfp pilus assembly protein PilO